MTSSRLNAKARAYMKSHPGVNYTEALSIVSKTSDTPLLSGVMSDMLKRLTGDGAPAPDLETAMQNLGFEFPPNPDAASPISAAGARQGDVAKVGERYGLVLDSHTILLDGKITALSDYEGVEFFRLPAPPSARGSDDELEQAKSAAAELLGAPSHAVWEETSVPLYAVQRGDVVQFDSSAGAYLGKGDILIGGDTIRLSDAGTATAVFRARFDTAPHNPETPDGVSLYSVVGGDVAERWRKNEFTNDLHVPLGYDVADNRVFGINLAEASAGGTGPHGVIQGSTGTGKSVLVSNIIMALAADNSPTKVTFALAESKGAFAARSVEGLPHVVKTWGRLEDDTEAQSDFKDFILQELSRREELLYGMDTRDISAYTAARASDSTLPALPRLIVITDDMAPVRQHVAPALSAVATKGRSLGIHLLLAEQHVDHLQWHALQAHMSYGITFRCRSDMASRTVLGVRDGTDLPAGRGDALVRYSDAHGVEHIEGFRTLRNGVAHESDYAMLRARILKAASAPS